MQAWPTQPGGRGAAAALQTLRGQEPELVEGNQ
jgi:hypothetical protein